MIYLFYDNNGIRAVESLTRRKGKFDYSLETYKILQSRLGTSELSGVSEPSSHSSIKCKSKSERWIFVESLKKKTPFPVLTFQYGRITNFLAQKIVFMWNRLFLR